MKRELSLVEEYPVKSIRMALLAIVGSHHVNGVAELHSTLLTTNLFPQIYNLNPEKFINVTNGVTPRRWIKQANPDLAKFITKTLKTKEWLKDFALISELRNFLDDEKVLKKWAKIKMRNKKRLVKYIKNNFNVVVPQEALFDIMVKRIHEYKRQLLNILYVIWRYRQLKGMSDEEKLDQVPRVVIFEEKQLLDTIWLK